MAHDASGSPTEAGAPNPPSSPPAARRETTLDRGGGERFGLAVQLDRVEARLERLLVETEETGDDVQAIARYLTAAPAQKAEEKSLAELLARVEAAHERLEELAGAVSRLNRVQFKANALQDAGSEQVREALATLQEIAARREQVRAARGAEEARRPAESRAQGRLEMAVELLPVVDGMDRALESGAALLERLRTAALPRAGERPADSPGLLRTLLQVLPGGSVAPAAEGPERAECADALEAWLEGIELGRERFLALLAEEGIRTIPALDVPFDPRMHSAVARETRAGVAPGTVIRVLRTGYQHRETPLRFAEVVVSRVEEAAGEDEAG